MRIAALDDDALQLDLFKQALEAMGHICHTHLTGADLLRELRRETFDLLIFGPYRFFPESRSIEISGKPVELKNREYDLALFLFQNMGRLLSRDHLKEILWGQVPDVMSRSLDTHISRLRTQLDLRPANGFMVTAVYGVGYRFEA
eukprot:gene15127-14927_t